MGCRGIRKRTMVEGGQHLFFQDINPVKSRIVKPGRGLEANFLKKKWPQEWEAGKSEALKRGVILLKILLTDSRLYPEPPDQFFSKSEDVEKINKKIRKFLADAFLMAHQIRLLVLIDLSGWSDMLASTTNELELFFQKDSKFLMDVFYWLIRSGSSCWSIWVVGVICYLQKRTRYGGFCDSEAEYRNWLYSTAT